MGSDFTRMYRQDMASRVDSEGATCENPNAVPFMGSVCILCGPNSYKQDPSESMTELCIH